MERKYSRSEILQILRQEKINEMKKAQIQQQFQKARAEFQRNEEIRIQQEKIRQMQKKPKKIIKNWGIKVW